MSSSETTNDNEAQIFGKKLLEGAIDGKDVDAFCQHFSETATWFINTSPPAVGQDAIRAVTTALVKVDDATQTSRHHDLQGHYDKTTRSMSVYGMVDYSSGTGDDVKVVTCTFCDVFLFDEEGKIAECRTFMDTTPLLPPPPASSS